jgi:hypothetical protein
MAEALATAMESTPRAVNFGPDAASFGGGPVSAEGLAWTADRCRAHAGKEDTVMFSEAHIARSRASSGGL